MQAIWSWRLWGFSINEARYYGWRWALHVGPLHLFVGKTVPAQTRIHGGGSNG